MALSDLFTELGNLYGSNEAIPNLISEQLIPAYGMRAASKDLEDVYASIAEDTYLSQQHGVWLAFLILAYKLEDWEYFTCGVQMLESCCIVERIVVSEDPLIQRWAFLVDLDVAATWCLHLVSHQVIAKSMYSLHWWLSQYVMRRPSLIERIREQLLTFPESDLTRMHLMNSGLCQAADAHFVNDIQALLRLGPRWCREGLSLTQILEAAHSQPYPDLYAVAWWLHAELPSEEDEQCILRCISSESIGFWLLLVMTHVRNIPSALTSGKVASFCLQLYHERNLQLCLVAMDNLLPLETAPWVRHLIVAIKAWEISLNSEQHTNFCEFS